MTDPALPENPPTVTLPAGTVLYRVHQAAFGPLFFGPLPGKPPNFRFDAPSGEYRTLYAAQQLSGAFVETILRQPRGRILRRAFVDLRGWTTLTTASDLNLVKLHGDGLQPLGVDTHFLTDDVYAGCQALGKTLFEKYTGLHGIAYRSKYNNDELCYAIFDRVPQTGFAISAFQPFADSETLVNQLMAGYGAKFDTSGALPPLADLK